MQKYNCGSGFANPAFTLSEPQIRADFTDYADLSGKKIPCDSAFIMETEILPHMCANFPNPLSNRKSGTETVSAICEICVNLRFRQ